MKKIFIITFISTICLILIEGSFHTSFGWELNRSPRSKEIKIVAVDEQKLLPSLKEIRRNIKEKRYNFTVGETWVFKLPPEKFNKMLGVIPFHFDESRMKKVSYQANLPSSFDWRDTDKVTSVKDQGECGTCWAHAAMGDLESKILIKENVDYDFSEQNLASCDFYNSLGPPYTVCSGGNPYRSTNFFTQVGVSMESCAPYQGVDDAPCTDTCEIIKKIDGWKLIANDVNTIKAALYSNGPIATTMFASDPAFKAYTDGVYELYGTVLNNHAVLIVGWDDTLGPEGAWIVKNSWGTDWGVDGYFYIAYGAAGIGTLSNYISSYKDYDENDILMYYDDAGITGDFSSVGAGSPTAWCAVIFTPSITGILRAVDFWAVSNNASYEIRIYDGMVNGTMGNLLALQAGECEEAGYYSIPLFIPHPITSDDDFVVSIKLTTPGYNYPIPVDDNGFASVESGLCYLSEDGELWIPIGVDTDIPYDVAIRVRIIEGGSALWGSLYDMMLGEDVGKNLSLLRGFRDNFLLSQQAGKKYVNLLYKHSDEIVTLLLQNPSLIKEAGRLIDRLLPEITNLLNDGVMKLSREELASIESFLTQCEIEATPRLKLVIRKVKKDISKGKGFKQLGIKVNKR